MKLYVFIILIVLGSIAFLIANAREVPLAGGYLAVYLTVVFGLRRWYLISQRKLPWWYFWNPKNILDQFKKP